MPGFKIVIESYKEVVERRAETDKIYSDIVEMVANDPEMAARPLVRASEIGQPVFYEFILDISGSMREFYDELVTCLNDIMIPALHGAAERYRGPMRLGCLLFSSELVPAWRGFKSLKELGPKPLKREMLDHPGLQGTTALYDAMRYGILWTAAAMEHMRKNGKGETPKGRILVLTDGANNEEPMDEAAVVQAWESIGEQNRRAFMNRRRGQENYWKIIGYFNTGHARGLTEVQFNDMASATGFRGCELCYIMRGETLEDHGRSFRHFFEFFDVQI